MWLASRHDYAFDWSQAGCSIRLNPAGYWWAAAPEEEWPEDDDQIAEIRANFVGEYGDRHQELVFIGQNLDQHLIESMLDDCLLTASWIWPWFKPFKICTTTSTFPSFAA